jgi:hypothetical protein
MIHLLHALIAVVTFLLVLNTFLRGAQKRQISIFLGLFLIALLISCFAIFGLQAGLIGLLFTFLYSAVSRPLAARFAAKLLGLPGETSAQYVGLPASALESISQDLSPSASLEEMVKDLVSGRERREKAEEALLDYCEARAEVRKIMQEFKASRATLGELYTQLILAGAGQWRGGHFVAASAIAYPQTLRYLLEHRTKRDLPPEVAWKLLMHFESGATLGQEHRA